MTAWPGECRWLRRLCRGRDAKPHASAAGLVAVRHRQLLGLTAWQEAGVRAAVVAHRHRLPAQVHDLDLVRMTTVTLAPVSVIAAVRRRGSPLLHLHRDPILRTLTHVPHHLVRALHHRLFPSGMAATPIMDPPARWRSPG